MSLRMYSVTPKRENVENQLQNCCKLSAEATLLKKMQFVSVVHAFFYYFIWSYDFMYRSPQPIGYFRKANMYNQK